MASIQSTTRDARIDLRLSQEHKRMIEQAASVTGQSLSDFTEAHLVEAAQRAIEAATVTQLSIRDSDTFLGLIECDAKPNKALNDAVNRHKNRLA